MDTFLDFDRWAAETNWQHSWPWPIWSAVAFGMVLSLLVFAIYRREKKTLSQRAWLSLLAIRIGVCWLLVWMLFGWLRERHRTEPADLVIGLDDSASMRFSDDHWDGPSAARLRRLFPTGQGYRPTRFDIALQLLKDEQFGWLDTLAKQYQLRFVRIGESPRESSAAEILQLSGGTADQQASALGSGVRSVLESQRGRPTAAFIVLTDGVNNRGPSIAEVSDLARQHSIPLYPVGLGSDQLIPDVRLTDLLADDVAFVDDIVTVGVQMESVGFAGQSTTVRLIRTDTGAVLAQRDVAIPDDSQRANVELSFSVTEAGEYPLAIVASRFENESDTENNRLTHDLTVYDATIRVLLVQSQPSYEYRFLSNLLGRATKSSGEKLIELTRVLQEADAVDSSGDDELPTFPLQRDELFNFDVVIFGDVDPNQLGSVAAANLVSFVQDRGGGVVFIAGPRFMPMAYRTNAIAKLFPFDPAKVSSDSDSLAEPFQVELSPLGRLWPPCQLTPNADENARIWQSLPGLYWTLDIPEPIRGARTVIQHAGRTIALGQKLPIVLTHYVGAGRVVFQTTDETYRWSRYEESDELYSRYWLQTIRELSRSKLRSNRSPAEISVDQQSFAEGERVPIRVRFWQPGSLSQGEKTVSVIVEHQQGRREQIDLNLTPGSEGLFSGSATDLSAGSYRVWLGSPPVDPPPTARSFAIAPPSQETTPRPMNAVDLERAAKTSGGRFFTLKNVDGLLDQLPRGRRVRIETLPPETKWNDPAIAALFVLLLTTEWVLRKRAGLL